jgi:hypothetical protein
VGSTIEYVKDVYYIWKNLADPSNKPFDPSNPSNPNTPIVPDQTLGQELINNFSVLPISRSSSQDTITAFDDSVLQTPRTRVWQLSNPTVMGTIPTTHIPGVNEIASTSKVTTDILDGKNLN